MTKAPRFGLRWRVVVLLACGITANYLARSSLAVVAPVLHRELGITIREYSYVVAGFQGAYTLVQPAVGLVLDHLGLRIGFTIFAVLWSLANMLHALAGGWEGLMACRILLGASEAAIFPAGLKAVREWFPGQERSVATGWFNIGSSVGAMLAQPLVVWCILIQGWQTAFIVTGGIGLAWAGAWFWLYRTPAEHSSLSAAEFDYIRAGQEQPTAGKPSIRSILIRPNFLGLAIARFFAEPAWQTFSFWIPLYLSTVKHMNLYQIAAFAWLPFLAADLGAVVGGYLAPLFMRWGRVSLLNSRKWVAVCGTALMIGPASIGLTTGAVEAVALFCVGGFAHQMLSGALFTASSDLFDDHEVATACGLIGTVGYSGGLIFSLMIGKFAPMIGYNPLFLCLLLFDVVGVSTMCLLVRPRSAVAPSWVAEQSRLNPSCPD